MGMYDANGEGAMKLQYDWLEFQNCPTDLHPMAHYYEWKVL